MIMSFLKDNKKYQLHEYIIQGSRTQAEKLKILQR